MISDFQLRPWRPYSQACPAHLWQHPPLYSPLPHIPAIAISRIIYRGCSDAATTQLAPPIAIIARRHTHHPK